jgi:tyrosyl-tRNA synthetase
MSISDELMWRYIDLLSFQPADVVRRWKDETAQGANPRDVKIRFAGEIVERFHDAAAARRAEEEFESRFRHGAMPAEMPHVEVHVSGSTSIAQVLKQAGLVPSVSEAQRLIEQGGVRLDGATLSDKARKASAGETFVAQVGKRKFARITIK